MLFDDYHELCNSLISDWEVDDEVVVVVQFFGR